MSDMGSFFGNAKKFARATAKAHELAVKKASEMRIEKERVSIYDQARAKTLADTLATPGRKATILTDPSFSNPLLAPGNKR
jgi:basic membrane lipoprotein Med (substrate-binding protein (PBP1-ABC) superfamily)